MISSSAVSADSAATTMTRRGGASPSPQSLLLLLPSLLLLSTASAMVIELTTVMTAASVAKSVLFEAIENWGAIKQLLDGKDPTAEGIDFVARAVRGLEARLAALKDGAGPLGGADVMSSVDIKDARLHELADLASRVDALHAIMVGYAATAGALETTTVRNFAEACVSHDTANLRGVMERIYAMVAPRHDGQAEGLVHRGVLGRVVKAMEASDDYVCSLQQSPNQLIYDMYDRILLTHVKAFALMQYSWMMLRLHGAGNFTYEVQASRVDYEQRMNALVDTARAALAEADTALWRCDPKRHVDGETHVEMTRVLQGFIVNEVDMNTDNACTETCWAYDDTRTHGCYKNEFCSRQPECKGRIKWCRFVDSDMQLCLASWNSTRRYDWINFDDGRLYGEKTQCRRGTQTVESWSRWLIWRCHYCLCLCDESGPKSDRFFSLREQISDVANNKVIVGLRFTKHKRIVHLQIGEATLTPGGRVRTAAEWRPVPEMNVRFSTEGVDYRELSLDQRSLDLDDLRGPRGHVMTGVRLVASGSRLSLEVQTTPFNYTTGELAKPNEARWISKRHEAGRTQLEIPDAGVPTHYSGARRHRVDSSTNQFLKFTHTDLVKDAAQTTIPFVDLQPVVSASPVPLTGAGLYHRGLTGSGGFVAPKVFTYDHVDHMDVKTNYWPEENKGIVTTTTPTTDETVMVADSFMDNEIPWSVFESQQ